jgi:hypothetical protein
MQLYSYRGDIDGIYNEVWTYKLKGMVFEGQGGMHVTPDEINIIPVWQSNFEHFPSI